MFFFSFSWHKGTMKKCQWSIICFFNSKSSPVLVDVNFTWITVQLAAICYWAEIMHGFLRCCGKSLIWGALGYAFLIIQHIISFNFDIFTNKKKIWILVFMFLLPPTTFTEMIYGGSYLRCILLAPVGLGNSRSFMAYLQTPTQGTAV